MRSGRTLRSATGAGPGTRRSGVVLGRSSRRVMVPGSGPRPLAARRSGSRWVLGPGIVRGPREVARGFAERVGRRLRRTPILRLDARIDLLAVDLHLQIGRAHV